ncbi:putative sporulation transcription regulator WhiA [Bacilli bacterium]|nr:putative sporulation transcription regulator WhiA [Bacilli bacterium]
MQNTIRMINNFMGELYTVDKEISFTDVNRLNNRRTYKLSIKGNFQQISTDLQLNESYPSSILKNVDDQRAYLVGAFLSGGSISSINKSVYHLEIRSGKSNYLRLLQKLLAQFRISISMLKRKDYYVLYIKKATDISDFLKIIGAKNGMQQMEDKIISRDYFTSVNRLNNLDVANLKKSISAGIQQVKMIMKVRGTNEFKDQLDKFKFFCTVRLNNPEASLTEIKRIFKTKYGITITRTGLNHYVLKLRELVLHVQ